MSNVSRTVVRLGFRLDRIGAQAVDQRTNAAPVIWHGDDVEFQFAAIASDVALASLAQLAFVRFDILPAAIPVGDDNPLITAQIDAAEIDNAITLQQWSDRTHAQGAVVFTRAQTSALTLAAGQTTTQFWLIAWGLTTDSPARQVTLGAATLTVLRPRSGGTPPDPDPGQVWLDVDAADLRYAPIAWASQISIPAGMRLRVTNEGSIIVETII